ncbi:MAG: alkyl hydroperoxide reductase [Planctomycetota bacterium]
MSQDNKLVPIPSWHRTVLRCAAVYNLVWGAIAILFPMLLFQLVGLNPLPNYPEFWQCIGMIVGVYGIGYWIAGNDPVRHWPIVLVGLLGKIFGPIGFAQSLLNGRFPLAMGATILTNDLIWWIPFSLILLHAKRNNEVACRP